MEKEAALDDVVEEYLVPESQGVNPRLDDPMDLSDRVDLDRIRCYMPEGCPEGFEGWYKDELMEGVPLVLLDTPDMDGTGYMVSYLVRRKRWKLGFSPMGEIPWKHTPTQYLLSLMVKSVTSCMMVAEGYDCAFYIPESGKWSRIMVVEPWAHMTLMRDGIDAISAGIRSRYPQVSQVLRYTLDNVCKEVGLSYRFPERWVEPEDPLEPDLERVQEHRGPAREESMGSKVLGIGKVLLSDLIGIDTMGML